MGQRGRGNPNAPAAQSLGCAAEEGFGEPRDVRETFPERWQPDLEAGEELAQSGIEVPVEYR